MDTYRQFMRAMVKVKPVGQKKGTNITACRKECLESGYAWKMNEMEGF